MIIRLCPPMYTFPDSFQKNWHDHRKFSRFQFHKIPHCSGGMMSCTSWFSNYSSSNLLKNLSKFQGFCSWYRLWHLINFEQNLSCLIFAQTKVFHPCFMETTTLISIWLQLSHKWQHRIAYNFHHISFFGNLKLPIWIFQKNWNSYYLFNVNHFNEHYEVRKDEESISSGKWEIVL